MNKVAQICGFLTWRLGLVRDYDSLRVSTEVSRGRRIRLHHNITLFCSLSFLRAKKWKVCSSVGRK